MRSVTVGLATKSKLLQLRSAEEVTDTEVDTFYSRMATYYDTVCKYLLSHLPLNDEFLKQITWIDPKEFKHVDSDTVVECALR